MNPNTQRTSIRWISHDGTLFRLSGPGEGSEGVLLMPGPDGLYFSPVDHLMTRSAAGTATWRGRRTNPAVLDFTVDINPNTAGGFHGAHDRFMRSWRDDKLGWLAVFSPVGWWHLRCRLQQATLLGEIDPALQGTQIDMEALADDPYWRSFPDETKWEAPQGSESRFVTKEVWVKNRGEVDVWPRFVLPGPGQWRIKTSTGFVTLPRIREGETIYVDTDEERQTVKTAAGENLMRHVSGRFTEADHVPAGGAVRELGLLGGTPGQKALIVSVPARRWPW